MAYSPAEYSDLEKRAVWAMERTWDGIGPDVLGPIEDNATMTQAEVIEVVLDAGHLEEYGEDKAAALFLRQVSEDERMRMARKAFPNQTWGW